MYQITNRIFSTLYYINVVCTRFLHIISYGHDFGGGGRDIEHKMCFVFLYNFCLKRYKNNSAKYCHNLIPLPQIQLRLQ